MTVTNLVNHYLIHSCLYYHHDISVISDTEYDRICKDLLASWGEVQAHPHRHLLTQEALEAGSGYHLHYFDYPSVVRGICEAEKRWQEEGRGSYIKWLEENYVDAPRSTPGPDSDGTGSDGRHRQMQLFQ